MSKWRDPYDDKKFIEEKDNYILVVGGDGTLLRAIKMHKDKNKPFLPIAGGTVNFLMNKGGIPIVPRLSDYEVLELQMLKVLMGQDQVFEAFNEVAIGSFCGWHNYQTYPGMDAEGMLSEFKGAGISISTAQGSTGLNRNCGGTILSLKSSNWSLVGMQTNTRIDYVTKPEPIGLHISSRNTFEIRIDGQIVRTRKDQAVTITKGRTIKLLVRDLSEYLERRRHAK
jgi:NAD+ kinase